MSILRIGEVSISVIPWNFMDDSLFCGYALLEKICEYLHNLLLKIRRWLRVNLFLFLTEVHC